ncbi:hypothetical protein TNCV_2411621 [Trichonephila clavipes]|nr:hypothetical protein TNCV_2411621 [Trichonephila clavipes]
MRLSCEQRVVGPYSVTILLPPFLSPGSSTTASRVRLPNPQSPSLTHWWLRYQRTLKNVHVEVSHNSRPSTQAVSSLFMH